MKNYLKYLTFALVICLTSCGEYIKVQKTTDRDYRYEAAKQYYALGQFNRAALFLQDAIAMLKGTEKGEESLFLLAMSSYKAQNYEAASAYFRKYYETYPKGTYAEKARFFSAMALYRNISEIKLDQSGTYRASSEFQNYLEFYPSGMYSSKAQSLIFELQDRLVEKEYLSAKLYYDLGSYFGNCTSGGSNYQACIVTAENAIKDYPYTTHREEFAILILRAKFELAEQSIESKKEERYHNAIDEYYGFTNEFPESKYMKEAYAMYSKAQKYAEEENTEANEKSTLTPEELIKKSAEKGTKGIK